MEEVIIMSLVVLVASVVAWRLRRADAVRSLELRDRFRSEYDRELSQRGRQVAERRLSQRQHRVETYGLRPLPPAARNTFRRKWREIEASFDRDPVGAQLRAGRLFTRVLLAAGYRPGPFERRLEDLSVYHPELVRTYKKARSATVLAVKKKASPSLLKQGLSHYGTLVESILSDEDLGSKEISRESRLAV